MLIATASDELAGPATNGGILGTEERKTTENADSANLDLNRTALVRGSGSAAAAVEAKAKDGKVFTIAVATVASEAGSDSEVSDIRKKIRRAERFGMAVVLSEEEKRNSRAERFRTASALAESEASKTSEELKRKARAERFGIPVPPTPTDEAAKKKARLARFGGHTKSESIEEDKKKARAIRFSKPITGPPSQVNGNGNIEQKAAITGEAV